MATQRRQGAVPTRWAAAKRREKVCEALLKYWLGMLGTNYTKYIYIIYNTKYKEEWVHIFVFLKMGSGCPTGCIYV